MSTTTNPVTTDEIVDLARTPKAAKTNEEGSVTERGVDELIKADQYDQNKCAQGAVPWGIRFARVKPPSPV